MKSFAFFPAAVLLAALFSFIAPAAAQMTATRSAVTLYDPGSNGGVTGSVTFDMSNAVVRPATVSYEVKLSPGDIPLGSGSITYSNQSESPFKTVDLFFSYSSLSPSGSSTIVFTITGATGIAVQSSYVFSLEYPGVMRILTVSGGSVVEGHTGTRVLPFTVTLNKVLPAPLTFNFAGSGGTAVAGQDYDATPGTATMPAGQTSVTVNLNINGDSTMEENETAGLALSGFSQLAQMNSTQTFGTIVTDDHLPGAVPFPVFVTELPGTGTMQAWFAVDLPVRTTPFSCSVSTRNGTALAGSDYRALAPVTITFASGEVQKWVAITVTASAEVETAEQFYLDVVSLDSQQLKSTACNIFPLTAAFEHPAPDSYVIRFPAGPFQRYVVEESTDLSPGGWTASSGVFTTGLVGRIMSHAIEGNAARKFFRVTMLGPQPPGPAAASS